MANNLVIVESPAKVKTIKKFLGKNYTIDASMGHVIDLPKSKLGVDIENDFEPQYITIRGKGELLAKLRKEVKKADKIYLATDPDREGEAISWHLISALRLEGKDYSRISFNEITKNAVKEALKNPREIDMNLVDAQQARRVLDRLVGYQISPILWVKVKRGLSAGRVQSASLRIIAKREDEIDAFIPEEYWSLDAELTLDGYKKTFIANYYGKNGKKSQIKNKEELDKIVNNIKNKEFSVEDIKTTRRNRKSPNPFTTSTMQQDASRLLNFATSKTMRVAQNLYEGVSIKGSGTVGLITYLRTDSTRISDEAKEVAHEYITENYGKEYSSNSNKKAKDSKNIQDAHEAIRPTDITRTPSSVKDSLSPDQFKLYNLIWKRFVASQMTEAVIETMSVKFKVGDYTFTSSASKTVFEGFKAVYNDKTDDKKSDNKELTKVEKDSKINQKELVEKQHFTSPPPRYNEASLVKTMEELGIGRPSTYAPTISTLLARRYISKEKKEIFLTEIGRIVDDILKKSFANIVDVNFTSRMESLLDDVSEGKVPWKKVIEGFYPDFNDALQKAENELEKVKIEDEVSDEVCELCGRNMVIKYGPHSKFLACPGFPECRNTKPYYEKIGVACPICGKDIVIKHTRKGRRYYGCIDYPNCEFTSWNKPVSKPCPRCGKYMVEKGNKIVCSDPECGYSEAKPKDN
ncbi:MAG: type I DNA topoisomerase [Lachnospiraceae bacterium]|jgi:DNA topoisomerase-1|nr:type I DNA topoisomerase [Lachnospiraceae bacterium]